MQPAFIGSKIFSNNKYGLPIKGSKAKQKSCSAYTSIFDDATPNEDIFGDLFIVFNIYQIFARLICSLGDRKCSILVASLIPFS